MTQIDIITKHVLSSINSYVSHINSVFNWSHISLFYNTCKAIEKGTMADHRTVIEVGHLPVTVSCYRDGGNHLVVSYDGRKVTTYIPL